jgi:hypothetical protein
MPHIVHGTAISRYPRANVLFIRQNRHKNSRSRVTIETTIALIGNDVGIKDVTRNSTTTSDTHGKISPAIAPSTKNRTYRQVIQDLILLRESFKA